MKPWSISTTVRNPERIRSFLSILKKMEGQIWDRPNQKKFQILLIQYKVYGAGEAQFYKDLTKEQVYLMDNPEPIEFEEAEEILDSKNYVGGGDMRGRQSFNPLEKMGLAFLDDDNKIRISNFGNYFLQEDYDLGEVFFRSFLKWQLPNPDTNDYKVEHGYNIKPFIATLHLINKVNKICNNKGTKAKGISRIEFMLFGLTLFNFEKIQEDAENLYKFREKFETLKTDIEKNKLIDDYIDKNLSHIDGTNNLNDYADNVIRYFRLTRYIYLRGNGWYIDLEPRRIVEINSILQNDNASAIVFENKADYRNYICDLAQPILPWENKNELIKIGEATVSDIKQYQKELAAKAIYYPTFDLIDFKNLSNENLKSFIQDIRDYRKKLQQLEIHHYSQQTIEVEKYSIELKNIFKSKSKKPVELERLCSLALIALNDAINIKPNYPVGDDNEPTFTAPANKPDIECYYETFNAICEVTMLTNRQQWYAEGQPVMRHLRDFENSNKKETYCLFIAPDLHRDTVNTYWNSVKYEYEGIKQKIIPMTINQFLILLDALIQRKKNGSKIYHHEMKLLFDSIVEITTRVNNSDIWLATIPETIIKWKNKIIA
ncbi:MAG TPA: AlwI family type II restriction endonuclease [Candidatus Kapabacteria bacterium]|nr:AlwI family type II restriction endonuclease [Candidatus Kapabacteria bacterium]HPO61728.1 AlwI family type II restriction endonuclease [Candidatus Kapabacteria bacterium]